MGPLLVPKLYLGPLFKYLYENIILMEHVSLFESIANDESLVPVGDYKFDAPEAGEYYGQLDAKHFSGDPIGSVFTEVKSSDDLLRLALSQNPELQDNRQDFVKLGVDPSAMGEGKKYIMVNTPGLDGSWYAGELDPETILTAHNSKGQVIDLVGDLPRKETSIGTLIMSMDNKLITAFPGEPKPPSNVSLQEGEQVRAGDLDPMTTVLATS